MPEKLPDEAETEISLAKKAPKAPNHPPMNFTDTNVQKLQVKDLAYDTYDTKEQRLVLRTGKRGKHWRVLYLDAKGKRCGEALGSWPEVSVKEAREKAAKNSR
ncbi:MAG: DUF4102 domain-containing protein [Afipia felis]|nr:DUF4102 domain-containing protein [Afipia felis]